MVKEKHIGIVAHDQYLEPYEDAIKGRHNHAVWKIDQLTQHGKQSLSDFANGYEYFGLHKVRGGWVFREWAPNATDIYLVGDFNDWKESEDYRCKKVEGTGNWELKVPTKAMRHGNLFKMHVKWNGGEGERIPAWATRAWCKTSRQRYSRLKFGPQGNTAGRKRSSRPLMTHCSSTSAT